MTANTFSTLAQEGCAHVLIAADENDWPLVWCRSVGFDDVALAALARG